MPKKAFEMRTRGIDTWDNELHLLDEVVPGDPCRNLLAAVLTVAIEDAQHGHKTAGYKTTKHAGRRVEGKVDYRLRDRARAWFQSRESERLCSFLGICTALDLDPERVRKEVQKEWRS